MLLLGMVNKMAKNRYVAFVDILGFKAMLESDPGSAKVSLGNFIDLMYEIWRKHNCVQSKLHCLIVSDCAVIHTEDEDVNSLEALLNLLVDIFKTAIFERGLFLLRAAICKGSFEELAVDNTDGRTENFESHLFLGQAYVDAFALEGAFKGAQIAFSGDVRKSICRIKNWKTKVYNKNKNHYCLKWQEIGAVLNKASCKQFVKLANKSGWLDHYYATLDMIFENTDEFNMIEEALYKIWRQIGECGGSNADNSKNSFIMNAFSYNDSLNYTETIAEFLRERLDKSYQMDKFFMTIPIQALFCPKSVRLFAGDKARKELEKEEIIADTIPNAIVQTILDTHRSMKYLEFPSIDVDKHQMINLCQIDSKEETMIFEVGCLTFHSTFPHGLKPTKILFLKGFSIGCTDGKATPFSNITLDLSITFNVDSDNEWLMPIAYAASMNDSTSLNLRNIVKASEANTQQAPIDLAHDIELAKKVIALTDTAYLMELYFPEASLATIKVTFHMALDAEKDDFVCNLKLDPNGSYFDDLAATWIEKHGEGIIWRAKG
jgi:hypothetical protein